LIVGEDYLSRTMAYSQDDIQNSLQVISYALEGLTNVGSYQNALSQNMLAAYTPVEIENTHWAIVVELAESEAFAGVHQLEKVFVVVMLIA
ncbi:hypothetical protein ACP3V3_22085, partial [Vibrio sp. PNB22_3_1]